MTKPPSRPTLRAERVLAVALAVGALLVAFTQPSSASAEQTPSHSSRDLVSALLLGSGPLTDDLGLDTISSEQSYTASAAAVTASFLRHEAAALEHPLADLRSGDVLRVEEGLSAIEASFTTYLDTVRSESELSKPISIIERTVRCTNDCDSGRGIVTPTAVAITFIFIIGIDKHDPTSRAQLVSRVADL